MDVVAATGYNGVLSLEIFNDQFRAGSPRGVAVDGQRSLVYLMDQLRGRVGAFADAAPRIPPRAHCLGIEFLEFAVDEANASKLAQLFAGLGFRRSASTSRRPSPVGRKAGSIFCSTVTTRASRIHI